MAKIKTVCYGRVEEWSSRKKALAFFMEGICACDPNSSECERYVSVYQDIVAGSPVAWDGVMVPGIPEIDERNEWFDGKAKEFEEEDE